jgi:hypothetical protein
LLLDGDPLQNIKNVEKLSTVVKEGTVVDFKR